MGYLLWRQPESGLGISRTPGVAKAPSPTDTPVAPQISRGTKKTIRHADLIKQLTEDGDCVEGQKLPQTEHENNLHYYIDTAKLNTKTIYTTTLTPPHWQRLSTPVKQTNKQRFK